MAVEQTLAEAPVDVLGWIVTRPIGRWHQSIVVTDLHIWVTPELAFADNAKLEAAAALGRPAFHDYVRSAGWVTRPPRCDLSAVRQLDWNETTGWMRVLCADDEVIGAMIPNRETGNRIKPLLKNAIASRVPKPSDKR